MTFLSFKEIGQEVGISDHSNFSRNFKKRFGISHFVGRNRLPVNNVLFSPPGARERTRSGMPGLAIWISPDGVSSPWIQISTVFPATLLTYMRCQLNPVRHSKIDQSNRRK